MSDRRILYATAVYDQDEIDAVLSVMNGEADSLRIGKHVRQMVDPYGGFILVHVATPVEVCEQRDRKGLYAKARAGILKEFTGISDPYEAPADAELTINTGELSPEEAAQQIILHLEREGFIGVTGAAASRSAQTRASRHHRAGDREGGRSGDQRRHRG